MEASTDDWGRFLATFLPMAVTFLPAALMAWAFSAMGAFDSWHRDARSIFGDAFKDDPEYAVQHILGEVIITTTSAQLPARVTARRRSPWIINVTGVRLSSRTGMTLRQLDRGRWKIKQAHDHDVVRGVLAVPEVEAAIDALFSERGVLGFELDRKGKLHVVVAPRKNLDPDDLRHALSLVRRIAELLDAHHDVERLLVARVKATVTSLGSETGSPVAVR